MNAANIRKLAGELSSFCEAAQAGADEIWTAAGAMTGKYACSPASRRRVESLPAELRRVGETLVAMTERYDALVREMEKP